MTNHHFSHLNPQFDGPKSRVKVTNNGILKLFNELESQSQRGRHFTFTVVVKGVLKPSNITLYSSQDYVRLFPLIVIYSR